MSEVETYDTNSEILFIYEASLCNPNGDPDDENRPRIDRKTNRNLVSDVRLKRFFRNYIVNRFGEEYIWVSKVEGQHVKAGARLQALSKEKRVEDVLKSCIDARLFGATIPIGAEKSGERGESKSYTGPLQFSWGYSLHPVELVESSTITSIFTGRGEEKETEEEEGETERYGTIGKDWRVHYSLIAFYGILSGLRAKLTKARPLDIKIFDNLLFKSVNLDATTRSKIGHWSHLYLRIEYEQPEHLMGDLRKYITAEFDTDKPIRDFEDIRLNFELLKNAIMNRGNVIKHIFIYESDEFAKKYNLSERLHELIGNKLVNLPHAINIDGNSLKL